MKEAVKMLNFSKNKYAIQVFVLNVTSFSQLCGYGKNLTFHPKKIIKLLIIDNIHNGNIK